nr:DNA/RNA non-specific endonuclease [Thiomicrorhabdus aquaedulcis]
MTNITPQNPKLNQKSWQRLEEIVANDFAKKHGEFWVVTGPIFNEQQPTLNNSRVVIPSAFYKILIKPTTPERPAIALAFIFEQDTPPNVNLQQLVTTVDAVEARTGIDFFGNLTTNSKHA